MHGSDPIYPWRPPASSSTESVEKLQNKNIVRILRRVSTVVGRAWATRATGRWAGQNKLSGFPFYLYMFSFPIL